MRSKETTPVPEKVRTCSIRNTASSIQMPLDGTLNWRKPHDHESDKHPNVCLRHEIFPVKYHGDVSQSRNPVYDAQLVYRTSRLQVCSNISDDMRCCFLTIIVRQNRRTVRGYIPPSPTLGRTLAGVIRWSSAYRGRVGKAVA
jgi:hypothetical protein